MQIQQSYNESGGKLYLVPTPIGNLNDMTFRAVEILKEADLIAAEDTRQTRKLLNHFGIHTSMVSYHEHNEEKSGEFLLNWLKSGKTVALVTDAGTPAISDPGFLLAREAIQEGIAVIALPGANAAITALIASGINPQPFLFYGFLPRKEKERIRELERLRAIPYTLIFYEAPHRLKKMMKDLRQVFGTRRTVLARELTKRFEEYVRGSINEVAEWLETNEPRGEFCIIVEGSVGEGEQTPWWQEFTIREHVRHYMNGGYSPMEAIKKTASDRQMPKREVYQIFHSQEEGKQKNP
jgi:conserved hypothetical protein TIGR00096